jgi:hypothetical protein
MGCLYGTIIFIPKLIKSTPLNSATYLRHKIYQIYFGDTFPPFLLGLGGLFLRPIAYMRLKLEYTLEGNNSHLILVSLLQKDTLSFLVLDINSIIFNSFLLTDSKIREAERHR